MFTLFLNYKTFGNMGYDLDDARKKLADVFETSLVSGTVQYFDTHEFVEIIDFFLDQNETVKAERAINNALNQHPNSTSIQIKKADWLYETSMLDEAEDLIDDIIEYEISNSEALELKGDILIKKEKQKEGILFLQKALIGAEDKSEIYSKIGIELMQIDELELALQFFLSSLDNNLDDESSLYNATYCYDFLDKQSDSISFLLKYINRAPYSQIAWHQLGLQYVMVEDYKKAIWAFDYATVVDDAFLGAFFEKAKCHEEVEDYNEAIDIYKRVQKMADPTAWTYHRLGEVYLKIDQAEQALLNFFNAIHEDPMHAGAWYKIGILYSLDSQAERSLEYAERAVEIEFDNIEYNTFLARLYMRLSKFEEADKIYENLISYEVDDANIWIEYFMLLNQLELENDSIEILLRSLSYFPENPEILYRLSGSLYGTGKEEEAVIFMREALKIDFEKKEILKINYPMVYHTEYVQDMIFAFKHQDKFF